MNYYQPRQLKNADGSPGLFHYTRKHDGDVWPVGNCANGCPGHATEEGACRHQEAYDIEHTRYDFEHGDTVNSRTEYRCVFPGCDAWTKKFAQVEGGDYAYDLCDEHRNPEGMKRVHVVGYVMSS